MKTNTTTAPPKAPRRPPAFRLDPSRVARGRPDADPGDRRRAARLPQRGTVRLYPQRGAGFGAPATGLLLDLSESGMGVAHCRQLIVGEQVVAELHGADGKPVWVLCNIARCTPAGDWLFQIGLAFVRELDADEAADEAEEG